MIAATSDILDRLGLLSVVLQSLQEKKVPGAVSDSLKERALSILKSAATINSNPHLIGADTSPEAIELALLMANQPLLLKRVHQLHALDGLRLEDAKKILNSLHSLAA